MKRSGFYANVFINCPFDTDYEPPLRAMLFSVSRFGLEPRIALERGDAGEARIDKILELICDSAFSIHDLSRCVATEPGEYYRLNMPFELGIDFAVRRIGTDAQRQKKILILEQRPHQSKVALSDIAGLDPSPHGGQVERLVDVVRNWFCGMVGFEDLPHSRLIGDYEDFNSWFVRTKGAAGYTADDMKKVSIPEWHRAIVQWLREERLAA